MKTIKKNVYYCDFCKKKGLSGGAISKHEKHCTGNVNRTCRMCGNSHRMNIPELVKELKLRFRVLPENERKWDEESTAQELIEWHSSKITLKEIEDYSEGCPSCTLTIIRGLNILPYEDFGFNYKQEVASWWEMVNEQAREEDERSTY